MNKTIIININGTVFHIEEDAYEILKAYMTNVKRHFMHSADSLEITTDIENRIAEMFNELLLREGKQVIIDADVNKVIDQMGRVEDFEDITDDNDNPASGTYNYNTGERRLFRDPDDRIVSGVCSGIANYFNIQPIWIRLAFALTTAFAGSGLLLYIILWIVIPQAVTRADRMAMRGHRPDLRGFKTNLQEELSGMRTHFSKLHEESRPAIYKMRDFAGDFAGHLGQFFNGAGKILIKTIGIAILIALFGMAIALIVTLISFVSFEQARINHIFPFTIVESNNAHWIYISAFATAFIPVLTLILVLITSLFGTRTISRSSGTTLLIVWVFALGTCIFYVTQTLASFRSRARFTQTTLLKATKDNIYHLTLNDIKYLSHDDSVRMNISDRFHGILIKNDDDDTEPRNVYINVVQSEGNQPELVEEFSAQGQDYETALMNARNTSYQFIQKDSIMQFDSKLTRKNDDRWHAEEILITLKLPLNSKVTVDENLNNRINMNDLNVDYCKNTNKQPNATSATFIMTANGSQCKVDTVVSAVSAMATKLKQQDSIRKATLDGQIARYNAKIDSLKKADSAVSK